MKEEGLQETGERVVDVEVIKVMEEMKEVVSGGEQGKGMWM